MEQELARLEEKEANDKESPLTIRLRARQRTEILKVPAIAGLVEDAVAEGMSVAVFVNFNDSADALAVKLKTKCCIRGGQGDDEREACIAAFQADKEPVIICNIKAGGVGVSLHGSPTARMRLAIICVTDSAQDAKQATGRVWRAKGAKSIQKFFFAAGTVEETHILPNMRKKIANIDTLNDGDLRLRCETAQAEQTAVSAPLPRPATESAPSEAPGVNYAAVAPVKTVEVKVQEPVAPVSEAFRAHVHLGMKRVAGCDNDRATQVNGVGFSKMDNDFGHSLAESVWLSDRQAHFAAKLCIKYGRQLGQEFLDRLNELKENQ
jgi:hypothetical protein